MQLCILSVHIIKCFRKDLIFEARTVHRQAKKVTYFKAKKFSKHWNESNVFPAAFLGLMTLRLFRSLKCRSLWGKSSLWYLLQGQSWSVAEVGECFRSARPESCNRACCVISRNPLPLVSLFPRVWKLSPCPWILGEGLGMAQHGFESVSSAPESCGVTLSSTRAG